MKPGGRPAVVILAAGKGTRMKSPLPKALQPLCGRPMIDALLESARALKPARTVVVAGFGADRVRRHVNGTARVALQKPLLGSGHAVAQAKKALSGFSGDVVVLYCDTPLVRPETLSALLERHRSAGADVTLLSVDAPDPAGYGRVKRASDGAVTAIVEENDATDAERAIREVNVGCYVFDSRKLFGALKRVPKNPKKGEYYLTDAVGLLAAEGRAEAVKSRDLGETHGVNSPAELARAGAILQERVLERLAEAGVRVRDPRTTTVDADVKVGEGTTILPHTVIEEGSVIGRGCVIGPFARIRGGSRIGDRCIVGNFVEVVRSTVGAGSNVKHLAYLGDARLGKNVNVGAGTITANYDGKKKHLTVVKDGASLGSGTVLIAPLTVGRGAVTAAGAVVTKGTRVPDRATMVGVPAKAAKKGKK